MKKTYNVEVDVSGIIDIVIKARSKKDAEKIAKKAVEKMYINAEAWKDKAIEDVTETIDYSPYEAERID